MSAAIRSRWRGSSPVRRAGKPFLDPVKVSGVAHLGATGADDWAAAVLQFPNGIIAEVSGSVMVAQDNVLRIYGTTGRIEVKSTLVRHRRQGGTGDDRHPPQGRRPRPSRVEEPGWLYSFEIDAAGARHPRRQAGIRPRPA